MMSELFVVPLSSSILLEEILWATVIAISILNVAEYCMEFKSEMQLGPFFVSKLTVEKLPFCNSAMSLIVL